MTDKISKHNFGFTLIELIIVISIMGILGLIFTDTIINTLRSENKVRIINQVKQNGQVVLDKLSNEIRQADRVVCIGTTSANALDTKDTIVISKGGYYFRYRLQKPIGANGHFTVESFKVDTYPTDIRTLSEGYYCTDSSSFNQIPLTDQDLVNGVSFDFDSDNNQAALPVFSFNSDKFKDSITITFKASESVNSGKNYENQTQVSFVTAVQVKSK